MNKKDQKIFVDMIKQNILQKGIKIGFFLEKVGLSRTHWYFISKGERPLTDEKIKKIDQFINS